MQHGICIISGVAAKTDLVKADFTVNFFSYPVLQSKEKIFTNSYKFRATDRTFIMLRSQWFSFINPWTKELEYIVSTNTVVL